MVTKKRKVNEPKKSKKKEKIEMDAEENSIDDEYDIFNYQDGFKQQTSTNLYLDTVNRERLDFDFENLCSISLLNTNVYACLVCGKYFQGRGKNSYAYLHSINEDHHVYVNLSTLKVIFPIYFLVLHIT